LTSRKTFLHSAGLIATIAVGVAAFMTVAQRDGDVTIGTAITDYTTPGLRSASAVPSELLNDTFGSVQVWTGSELLAFGSDISKGMERSGGVAYNPAAGAWRRLAASSFEVPVANPVGLWTGDRLIILGTLCGNNSADPQDEAPVCSPGALSAAAYHPKDDRWEAIEPPPHDRSAYKSGSSGGDQRALGAVGGNAFFTVSGATWMLSPSDNKWQAVPGTPATTQAYCAGEQSLAAVQADVAAKGMWTVSTFRPGDTEWTNYPGVKLATGDSEYAKVVCGPTGALLISVDLQKGQFFDDSVGGWKVVPPAPSDLATRPPPPGAKATEIPPIDTFLWGAWTGSSYAFWQPDVEADETSPAWPGVALSLDPSIGKWTSAAPGPRGDRGLVWIDGYSLSIGRMGDQLAAVIYVP